MKLHIPEKNKLRHIIASDPGQLIYTSKRYYSKLYRIPFIKRLKLVLSLMGNKRYDKLLDIGFGSGFFIPELDLHCNNLYAVDIHKNIPLVKDMLQGEGVQAKIFYASVLDLPFRDKSFDCIICLSVLEFVEDTDRAISEIIRVAEYNATIIIGAPVLNKITDFCYDRLIRSKYHRILHKSNHKKIRYSIERYSSIKRILSYPFFAPVDFSLFFVIKTAKQR